MIRMLTLLVVGAAPAAFGFPQLPVARPQFEAVSIKPSNSADRRLLFDVKPGLVRCANVTAKRLIQQAYAVRAYQLEGGPGWTGSDLFDLTAKAETAVSRDELNLMFELGKPLSEIGKCRLKNLTPSI